MPGWQVAVVVVVGFMVIRAAVFGYLLWRADRLAALMDAYWRDEKTWAEAGGRKREIAGLFRIARLRRPGYDLYKAAPGGYLRRDASVFDNIFAKNADVVQLVFDAFIEAKGYFRDEIRRSLIPVFWPSVIGNIPADILVYVGVQPESTARTARAAGWLATVAGAIIGAIQLLI